MKEQSRTLQERHDSSSDTPAQIPARRYFSQGTEKEKMIIKKRSF
jgi:hypothetical protein